MQSNYRQIPFYLLIIFLIDRILLLKAMESWLATNLMG